MQTLTAPIDHGRRRLSTAMVPTALVVALLWLVFIADKAFGLHLYRFGILPRELSGLIGIVASPFIHADLQHISGNSLPALVLGWLLVYFYPKAALRVVVVCWLVGGALVWGFGRPSFHFGASGVIYGLAAFLFFSGLLKRQLAHAGLSFMVIALYGSWIWGVLPIEPEKSWESHLAGAMVGALMAWMYRDLRPAHVPEPLELADDEEALPEELEETQGPLPAPPAPWPHGPNSNSTLPF